MTGNLCRRVEPIKNIKKAVDVKITITRDKPYAILARRSNVRNHQIAIGIQRQRGRLKRLMIQPKDRIWWRGLPLLHANLTGCGAAKPL